LSYEEAILDENHMLSDAHAHLQDLPGGGLFSTYVAGGLRENSQQQAIFQNVCVCSAMAEGNQAKWSVFWMPRQRDD